MVYSHMTLKSLSRPQDSVVRHQIIRQSCTKLHRKKQKTRVLLERETVMRKSLLSYYSSFVMDAVYLNRGDVIYPDISPESAVYRMHDANFWGVIAIISKDDIEKN